MVGIKMIYYKSKTGEVFAYETEAERQKWGAPELVKMTKTEIEAHLNPTPTPEQLAARNLKAGKLAAYLARNNMADVNPDFLHWDTLAILAGTNPPSEATKLVVMEMLRAGS